VHIREVSIESSYDTVGSARGSAPVDTMPEARILSERQDDRKTPYTRINDGYDRRCHYPLLSVITARCMGRITTYTNTLKVVVTDLIETARELCPGLLFVSPDTSR
jgi:hypothetical protein